MPRGSKRSGEGAAIAIAHIALRARAATGLQTKRAPAAAALSENRVRSPCRLSREQAAPFVVASRQGTSFQESPLTENLQHQVLERVIRDGSNITEFVTATVVFHRLAVLFELRAVSS